MKKKILISRTDSIGDVVLTLPLVKALKDLEPQAEITFLCRSYTKSILEAAGISSLICLEELESLSFAEQKKVIADFHFDIAIHVFPRRSLAKLLATAKIPVRIGTSHRWYHWLHCNQLVAMRRRQSPHHEGRLNLELLRGLDKKIDASQLDQIWTRLKQETFLLRKTRFREKNSSKYKVILHPYSLGSAREWPEAHFLQLIELLPAQSFEIFISGTKEDKKRAGNFDAKLPSHVHNVMGTMTLTEFINFIQHSDALVACSTGPLHIAAASGICAVGLYPPLKPIDPDRWAPIGDNAHFIVKKSTCSECSFPPRCLCMEGISPEQVALVLSNSLSNSPTKNHT
ncbi:MAG: glycosyltransferase family 9 protein [Oligoflexales bacterium]|nr:glycosyltransferase family 9 protein [Oligoflexales bacterium]